jgi:hypothetical protein
MYEKLSNPNKRVGKLKKQEDRERYLWVDVTRNNRVTENSAIIAEKNREIWTKKEKKEQPVYISSMLKKSE